MLLITRRSEIERAVYFQVLSVRDIFKVPHSAAVYMRIEPIYEVGSDEVVFNATNLTNGRAIFVEDREPVIPVEAELRLED